MVLDRENVLSYITEPLVGAVIDIDKGRHCHRRVQAVRVHRMGREGDFLRQVLLSGGNASEQAIASARGDALGEVFRAGPLARAAELGAKLAQPGGESLTAFERECDNALTAYLAAARRIPFGEETVIGYLYAKELEFTAIRAIFAGRAAGLDGETIRSRLRETYV